MGRSTDIAQVVETIAHFISSFVKNTSIWGWLKRCTISGDQTGDVIFFSHAGLKKIDREIFFRQNSQFGRLGVLIKILIRIRLIFLFYWFYYYKFFPLFTLFLLCLVLATCCDATKLNYLNWIRFCLLHNTYIIVAGVWWSILIF